jgi:hypothetical protein
MLIHKPGCVTTYVWDIPHRMIGTLAVVQSFFPSSPCVFCHDLCSELADCFETGRCNYTCPKKMFIRCWVHLELVFWGSFWRPTFINIFNKKKIGSKKTFTCHLLAIAKEPIYCKTHEGFLAYINGTGMVPRVFASFSIFFLNVPGTGAGTFT